MRRDTAQSQTSGWDSWFEFLPVVQLCRSYLRAWFREDLLAGFSVCAVMILSLIAGPYAAVTLLVFAKAYQLLARS